MPINYRFINNETGKDALLSDIDDEICRDFGIKPDKVNFSIPFMNIVYAGFFASRDTGRVSKNKLVKWYVEYGKPERKISKDKFFIYAKYLYKKYTFESWRGYR